MVGVKYSIKTDADAVNLTTSDYQLIFSKQFRLRFFIDMRWCHLVKRKHLDRRHT